jgi:hypothetical protein
VTRYVASLDEKLATLGIAERQARLFRDRLIEASDPGST